MADSDQDQLANLTAAVNEVLLRQARLEERLQAVERTLKVPPQVLDPIVAPPAATPVVSLANPVSLEQPAEPEPPARAFAAREEVPPAPALETRVGLTIINRIGAVTLVLGVAFFFKWAVDNNWIGPLGRVLLGLLAGFGALALADFLWRKAQQVFAQGITGTGIAIIYVAFYAAFDFYHLVYQSVAFVLLFATTVLAAALALRYRSNAIAALGLFGAYLIPLLLSNGEDHPWFLAAYLLMLNFAASRLAARRAWPLLDLLSLAGTTFIFGGWIFRFGFTPGDHWPAVIGILALYAQRFPSTWPVLFLWTQILTGLGLAFVSDARSDFILFSPLIAGAGLAFSHRRRYTALVPTAFAVFWLTALSQTNRGHAFTVLDVLGFLLFGAWLWWRSAILEEPATGLSLPVLALNGLLFYAAAYLSLHAAYQEWMGLMAVAVGTVYLAFGLLLYRKTRAEEDPLILLSLGMAAAFIALAIPIQFSGFSIAMGWAILAAALTWIGWRLNRTVAVVAGLVVFALSALSVTFVAAATHLDVNSYSLIFNERFFSFAVLSVALQLSAYWSRRIDIAYARVEFIAGHIAMLIGLSLEVLDWAKRSARPENLSSVETIGITILFAVYAIVLVSIGVASRSYLSRLAGLVLTAIVIAKLYILDVWQLSRVYQIIAFVILGVLLLSTSFLYSRFKNLIVEWGVKEPR